MKKMAAILCSAVVLYSCTVTVNAASKVSLDYLMSKYPDGKYWNHVGMSSNNADGWTNQPCSHSVYSGYYYSNGTCNSFGGDIQCAGFVNKLVYECYSTPSYDSWNTTTLSNLKAGDAVRFMYNSHSIFITAVDGENVTYGECNGDYAHCQIKWNQKTTKSQIARTLTKAYAAPSELSVSFDNKSYLSKANITFGERISAKAVGEGSKGYTYEFAVQKPKDDFYTVIQKYGTWQYCSYFPWESGRYLLRVNIKDTFGTVSTKVLSFTVTADELVNQSDIDKTELSYGENVTFRFAAEGGTKGYQYEVYAMKPRAEEWTKLRSYAYGSSYTYHPWESGTYRMKVCVKDSSGTVTEKEWDMTVTAPELTNSTTVTETLAYGDNAVFTFAAEGGTKGYQYQIDMYKPSSTEWIRLKNYSAVTSFQYHPWEVGEYRFQVTVKDLSDNTAVTEFSMNVTADPLEHLSAVPEKVTFGDNALMALAASGGSGAYRYKIEAFKPVSQTWVTLRDFSYAQDYSYHPWEQGEYLIRITVMDSLGNTLSTDYPMIVEA